MRTILYPDGNIPKPVYQNSRDDVYTLVLLSMILVVLIFTYIFYIFAKSQTYDNFLVTCPPGSCGTNLNNGNKRCPQSLEQSIFISPGTEVCNPPGACIDVLTPYAVNPDGSFNIDGICLEDICPCVGKRECPNYAMVVFNITSDGSDYTQNAVGTIPTGGEPSFIDTSQSCILDTGSFPYIGCPTYFSALECVQSNPCTIGQLSYIPPLGMNPSTFVQDPNNFNVSAVACIAGFNCEGGRVSVYNSVTNVAECVNIP